MKNAIIFLFFLLCKFVYSQEKHTIFFEWHNDTLNGEFFEKTSMHIPVEFEGDTTTYYFQFDTGSNKSFLYTGGKVDSAFCDRLTNEDGVESSIGRINLLKGNSNKIYREDGKTYIGTLGSDFIKDSKTEIDFSQQTLTFLDSYDQKQYNLTSVNLSFGRPVIKIVSEGKNYDLLFDTGSSLFEVWTTKKVWGKLRNKSSAIDEFPISSWGKINTAYRTNLNEAVSLSLCSSIFVKTIWYNSNKAFKKQFKEAGVDGIVGNKPFLDQIILIDIANKTMGIKKCK